MSAVIAAYNAAATLRLALDSILAQTVPVHEIILVDDGSSDKTAAIAHSYGQRIRLLSQANQGVSAARNRGVEIATGDWVAFLDADDRWFPEKIARQTEAVRRHSGAVLCYTGLLVHSLEGSHEEPALPPERVPAELRLGTGRILPSCVLISREAFFRVGAFRPEQKVGEDWDLWCRLLRVGPFCAVTEPLVHYTALPTSLSANPTLAYREARHQSRRMFPEMSPLPRWIWRRRMMANQSFSAAMTARSRSEHRLEVRYIALSFLWWPFGATGRPRVKAAVVTLRNLVLRSRGGSPRA